MIMPLVVLLIGVGVAVSVVIAMVAADQIKKEIARRPRCEYCLEDDGCYYLHPNGPGCKGWLQQ